MVWHDIEIERERARKREREKERERERARVIANHETTTKDDETMMIHDEE